MNDNVIGRTALVVAATVIYRLISVLIRNRVTAKRNARASIFGVTCSSCGTVNTQGASECWSCGAKL